jgi:hypothetical protein
MPRLLTKSRYKQALECPNKLYYTKKDEYANQKNNDSFLKALANGGFQVEELARLHYPEGVLIEGNDGDYDGLVDQTKQLLDQENVVIFEAAFLFENLFIRTDILVKSGNYIQLIEVKAKSFHPDNLEFHTSTWNSYVFDVAFQKYVIQKSFPHWKVSAYFMLADKSKTTTIKGLNQLFRITKKAGNRTGISKRLKELKDIESESVLSKVNIDDYISPIESNKKTILDGIRFEEGIQIFAKYYQDDTHFNYPITYSACKKCEFKASEEEIKKGKKSGFKECWSKQMKWTDNDFETPNLFDVWDFRRHKLFDEERKIFKKDISEDDLGYTVKAGELSRTERQWIQIQKDIEGDNEVEVLKKELREEMNKWVFPLNFIDFETSTSALPFYSGRKPYEQIAFQFSHHIIYEDGRIEHASEYINTTPGDFPNFKFIRALKEELEKNEGSIFKFATHENSIVNAIYEQLSQSNESDREILMAFIEKISHSKNKSVFGKWCGERDMIDLCEVIRKYYYNPYTKGSNSIKKVLPAIFEVSEYIKNKYSLPLKNINITSKNFDSDKIWIKSIDGKVQDPYESLPKPFEEWNEDFEAISEIEDVKDGGAALTAYGKIQYTDMSEEERRFIKEALLKYCELDTLAMVMIYEHLKEITK